MTKYQVSDSGSSGPLIVCSVVDDSIGLRMLDSIYHMTLRLL